MDFRLCAANCMLDTLMTLGILERKYWIWCYSFFSLSIFAHLSDLRKYSIQYQHRQSVLFPIMQ